MGNDDYGYFGKGSTGYAHYTQAHNQAFSGSNPSATSSGSTSSGGGPIFSGRKPTVSTGKPTPTNSVTDSETVFFLMMVLGTIFALLSGLIVALQISSCLHGWITVVEFSNEAAGWIICFIVSLICSISGFRHFFCL